MKFLLMVFMIFNLVACSGSKLAKLRQIMKRSGTEKMEKMELTH